MKKLIILLFVVFLVNETIQAQVPDTSLYLKQIEAAKANYIGKTFAELEKDLKITIKYFGTNAGIFNDKSKETSTGFYFIIPESMEEFGKNYIEVRWYPYLDHNKANEIYSNAPDDGNWIQEAKDFYRKGVIKDIKVR